jgi:hypothetical protein
MSTLCHGACERKTGLCERRWKKGPAAERARKERRSVEVMISHAAGMRWSCKEDFVAVVG